MRISVICDLLGTDKALYVSIGKARSTSVCGYYGVTWFRLVSIRSEDFPMEGNCWIMPVTGKEFSNVSTILDNNELISVEKSNPLEAANASQNAILFGGRRHGHMRPSLVKGDDSETDIRCQYIREVIPTTAFIKEEMLNASR